MKKIIPIILLLLFSTIAFSQNGRKGIKFQKMSLVEAGKKASKTGKLLFVDCYSKWCVPCKKMANEVFTDPEVGKLYNKYFVSIKLDMESPEGKKYQKKFKIDGYPTLLYMDSNCGVILRKLGARSVPDFIKLAQNALQRMDIEIEETPKGK